jgi:REP element-mobilizing transposase RayT
MGDGAEGGESPSGAPELQSTQVTYLITFACYGSHMHGDPEGSVDRSHNHYGGPLAKPNPRRLKAELQLMDQPPYELDGPRRRAVLDAITYRCQQSGWSLIAAHVRQNHVHLVIQAEEKPEFVMTQLKSAASRCLNDRGFDDRTRKRWARHGSTRTLFNQQTVQSSIRYVLEGQGEPMSTFQG